MPFIINSKRPILSEEEVEKLVSGEDAETNALFSILYLTGCRITEAIKLNRVNVLLDGSILRISTSPLKRGKSAFQVSRQLPINIVSPFQRQKPIEILCCKKIIEYLEIFDVGRTTSTNPEELLFTKSRNKAWRELKKLNETSWLHLFRSTRATLLAEIGWNEAQMVYWFGWTSFKMAQRYVKLSSTIIKGVV